MDRAEAYVFEALWAFRNHFINQTLLKQIAGAVTVHLRDNGFTLPAPLHRPDETTPPAEQRCGDCALWGTDMQDEERADALKHCPRWHCWTGKGLGPIHDCFVQKEEE